jgi:hypothetical protein
MFYFEDGSFKRELVCSWFSCWRFCSVPFWSLCLLKKSLR